MDIIEIAKTIKENGGNLYLVGGAIRDKLLGIESKDKDYCVTKLTKEQFKNLFPETFENGKAFSVFRIEHTEFAIARKEMKTGLGHKEFEVYTNNVTIEQDLARRDITINSIAQDVLTGELIDPFNGQKDIEQKIIKATTNAFSEDPLRVYRAARFASQFEFTIHEDTIKLMNSLKKELNTLSKERVFVEFKKALQTNKPSIFFESLKKADVLDIHFKEIYDLIGALQPEKYHPEGDSYVHTMMVVDEVAKTTKETEIRFAGLVHDLGKGATPKEMYPHHYGHDKKGIELVKKLGKNISLPTSYIKCGITSAKEHMRAGNFFQMKANKKVELIENVSKTILGIEGLQIVVNADKHCRGTCPQVPLWTGNCVSACGQSGGCGQPPLQPQFLPIANKMLTEIDGKYIEKKYNIKPSLELGKQLHQERIKWMKNIEKQCSKNIEKKC